MSKTLGTVQARRKNARPSPTAAPRKRYASQEKGNRWMITLNFGDEDELEQMSHRATIALRKLNAAAQVSPCIFAVFQPERGEDTGRLHIQAYFEFDKSMTLAQVRKHCGSDVWAEVAKGSQDECIAYCTKDDSRVPNGEIVRFGEPMKLNRKGGTSGSRTDWRGIVEMCKAGCMDAEILEAYPAAAPNARALQHVRFAYQCARSREETTKLLVLWGSPDAGKTTTAISLCEPGSYFVVTSDGKQLWWDGYDPDRHRTVIFDEFVGSRMPITFLNSLADKIDLNVQTKGGYARFLAQHVIITSNFSPREWYTQCAESRQEAMYRRITAEVEFQLVDQIIDMRRPQEMERRLHLRVHKGKFPFAALKTRYPLDDCCKAAQMDEIAQAVEDIDESSELRSSLGVEHDAQSPQLGDSQELAVVIEESSENEEEESDHEGSSVESDDPDPGDYDSYDSWHAARAKARRRAFDQRKFGRN